MPVKKRTLANLKEHTSENGLEMGDGHEEKSNIKGDELNIAVLLLLYTLQGIPLGLSSAIPMLLQNRGVTYTQQAEFSLVNWPFSMKLLWAPIVDALFFPSFGKRKTWLVSVQYLIGISMIIQSYYMTDWIGSDISSPSMYELTITFMFLNFLAATQDIAVDGWALTMLKRCNVGHASTCNTVGQTAGYFLGYVLFVALESPSFCNKYLRSEPKVEGVVTLASFLSFWGFVFIIVTTLVAIFKKEESYTLSEHRSKGWSDIKVAYKELYSIIKLPAVKSLALVLFTCKIGFAACDAVSGLKLVEAGVPREDLALFAVPLVPIQIMLPLILAKHSTGPEPLTLWLKAFPIRLMIGPLIAVTVALTPTLLGGERPSMTYLVFLISIYLFHQVCLYSMFVAVLAFFARVSDPRVGGTYMTLLNTLSNLGTNWPNTMALWAVDHFTWKQCSVIDTENNHCSNFAEIEQCSDLGGECETKVDGFYVEIGVCFFIGFVWLIWGRNKIKSLQRLPLRSWQLSR